MEPARNASSSPLTLEQRMTRLERIVELLVISVQECVEDLFEGGDPGV